MKRTTRSVLLMLLAALLLFLAGSISHAQAAQIAKTFAWQWPLPADNTTGISPRDLSTNYLFILHGHTNASINVSNWPVIALISPATIVPVPVGTNSAWWTNVVTVTDYPAQFFVMRVTNVTNGGVSPFSNVAPLLKAFGGYLGGILN